MDKVYSVSQLNKYIKMIFDKDTFLNNVNIRGEITNFKAHYTGHFYFTLKDDTSTIKCVMFKSYASLVKFKPTDGMKVVINGQVSVFERDGAYQIYCKSMTPEGLGELYLAYEQLKEKLTKEFGKEPTVEQIAKEVGVDKEEIVFSFEAIQDPLSLQEPVYNDGTESIYIMDQVSDSKSNDESWADSLTIEQAMKKLNDREKMIITKRFFDGRTQM